MVVGNRNKCINVNDKDVYKFDLFSLETAKTENSENEV